jgi:hypothetical protein
MRKMLCFAVAMGFAATAAADPVWTQPGWYRVSVTFNGPEMEEGPFEDEASCKETLPEGNDIYQFSCERFEEKPEFDE